MAAISITLNQATNTFSITLDKWEWTGLTVNGTSVPSSQGDIQFEFNQASPGNIHFVATANQYIDLVNPGNTMYIKGVENDTYMCLISYQETANPKVITLYGILAIIPAPVPGAVNGPITFSQGRMTGSFQTINKNINPNTSLVGTKWRLSMNQQGTEVNVNIAFNDSGKCSYGPYNCSYTQTESSFIILNPHDSSQVTKIAGTFNISNGTGEGMLTNEFNHQPIGLKIPFTLKKL